MDFLDSEMVKLMNQFYTKWSKVKYNSKYSTIHKTYLFRYKETMFSQ